MADFYMLLEQFFHKIACTEIMAAKIPLLNKIGVGAKTITKSKGYVNLTISGLARDFNIAYSFVIQGQS